MYEKYADFKKALIEAAQRQLREYGEIITHELAKEFGVTEFTIVHALENAGLIK